MHSAEQTFVSAPAAPQRATGGASMPWYAAQAGECALFEHCFAQQLPLLIKGPTG